jgi:YD repeat-containing protein
MVRRAWPVLTLLYLIGTAATARGQTTPYYLHKELDANYFFSGSLQLKTTGPDVASVAHQTADLKNFTGERTIDTFETQGSVPNLAGTIPSGSTITFTVFMKKTANYAVIYPRVGARINSGGTLLCSATGGTALSTTSYGPYTVSCQTTATVTMVATDHIYAWVSVWIPSNGGTNHTVKGELDIEGITAPIYDSRLVVPNPIPPTPTITSLSPTSGPANWSVTITGTNFGSSQGSSTVKFNGTLTTPTNWNTNGTSITAPVPPGASSGPVVVRVSGIDNTCSGSCTFTVVDPPSLTSANPPTAHITDAVTISGNNFMTSGTVTFNGTAGTPTSWNNTSISLPVPSGATSGNIVVTVSAQASNALPFTVIPPPTLTSVYPASGQVGLPVTIWGTNFGAAQGANTLKFNGTTATVTTWTDSRIDASVPAGATTGDVVVRVSNQPSNGVPFSVLVGGTLSGTITRFTGGTGLSGATVQAVLTGIVKGSATTAANGTYTISSLDPGAYDVRVSATGFSTELRQGIVITSSSTTTVDAAMYAPGAVSGKVTQSDGITPIAGAAVAIFAGPVQKGSTNTNATGDYTIAGLHPGAYTGQAANVGYRTSEQGAAVTENATTTRNFSLDGAASGPVQYAYDELGRLVQVTDPSGDAAIYRYDAVGNITAIERPGGTSVAISGFTPISGLIGAAVTIYGSGFSATPGQNTVTFNGVAATVTNSTSTQITTTVPSGATTGAIAVTTPIGSATSGTPFTVLTSSGAPTITGFTPGTIASGTALTVNGTNFETVPANNNLRVNISPVQVSSATATALQTSIPPSATTGRVSVATPNGSAVSSNYLWVAPPPYVAADLDSTGTLPFGTNAPLSVGTANKVALRVFDGTEGHRASLNVTGVTGGIASVNVYGPFGTVLDGTSVVGSAFIDTVTLNSTATYSVVFDPSTTNVTAGTLTLYDVPADFTGPISFGSAVNVETMVPGQNARLTFAGTAGQQLSITQTGDFNCFTGTTSIVAPDGSTVASTCGGLFLDRTNPLASTGTYTVLVDPKNANYGSTAITLYNVPADASGSTSIGGAGVPLSMSTPGQNGLVTFSGTAQQVVTIHVTGSSVGRGTLTLTTEGGQQVGSTPWLGTGDFTLSNQTLPATGNYKIIVDPYDANTGSLTVSTTSP